MVHMQSIVCTTLSVNEGLTLQRSWGRSGPKRASRRDTRSGRRPRPESTNLDDACNTEDQMSTSGEVSAVGQGTDRATDKTGQDIRQTERNDIRTEFQIRPQLTETIQTFRWRTWPVVKNRHSRDRRPTCVPIETGWDWFEKEDGVDGECAANETPNH